VQAALPGAWLSARQTTTRVREQGPLGSACNCEWV
jgi:hypothetical protein